MFSDSSDIRICEGEYFGLLPCAPQLRGAAATSHCPSEIITTSDSLPRSPAVPVIQGLQSYTIPYTQAIAEASDQVLHAELLRHRPSPHFDCHAHADDQSMHLAPGDP
ncbi:hypothetical protein N7537_001770 [Penicillium hordei]|uniref:Uncharacterized protein n=1 Tax=Penicillium hordei TaxID=40994 RepID=A0AAD6EGQ5_9EURO|nr:uncharacterized protein N7537_001770 [Penicillium hordei]KAJ5616656.1 hypothetical protein N7537_001770 [Penicillium hordei]